MLPATAHKVLTRKDHSPRYSDYVVVMTLEAKGISPTQPWMPFEFLYQSHEWHSGINGAPTGHLTLLTHENVISQAAADRQCQEADPGTPKDHNYQGSLAEPGHLDPFGLCQQYLSF